MAIIGMVVMLYIFTLVDTRHNLEAARRHEVELLKQEQEVLQELFSQTAVALVSAIDAKDAYTQGHSLRVAQYSRKIAEISGRSEKECDEIYYAALLHDVGKIGIPDGIINKNGKLTREEYALIKSHPVIGSQILSKINKYSYLSDAARHHHERMDGRGYPDRLKGEEIPVPARIISVADAYDAMTSNRSYRRYLPQATVRRELVRCSGTQFDPVFAGIMISLIDQDKDYRLRENGAEK
jgi:putative nucleotidyltransferase with HDIG domain